MLILDEAEEDIPYGFKKSSVKIGNDKVTAYRYVLDDDKNYYLVYAQNLQTGDKGFYVYDKEDASFQRYYENLDNSKNTIIMYLFFIAAGLLLIVLLIILISLFKKIFTKKERKIKKYQKKIDKLKEKLNNKEDKDNDNDSYDIESVDERPVIKKVEEDDYVVPKKSRKERNAELREAKKRLDKQKPKYRKLSLEDDEDDI